MPHGRTLIEQHAILEYLAGQRPWPELVATDFAAPVHQPSRTPRHRPAPRRQYLPISKPSQASEGLITDAMAAEPVRSRTPRIGITAFKAGNTPPAGTPLLVPAVYNSGTQWGGTQPWRIRRRKG